MANIAFAGKGILGRQGADSRAIGASKEKEDFDEVDRSGEVVQ
jgi:hypothetical protein